MPGRAPCGKKETGHIGGPFFHVLQKNSKKPSVLDLCLIVKQTERIWAIL